MFLNPFIIVSIIILFIVLLSILFINQYFQKTEFQEIEEYESDQDIILIKKLNIDATIPKRNHHNDAGLDLFSLENIILEPHKPVLCKTGIGLKLPIQHYGKIEDRSSMGLKGIKVLGGVIDEGYTGEIMVCLINLTNTIIQIDVNSKIAQLIIVPVVYPTPLEVKDLKKTERGINCFGSSGK